MGKTRPVIHFVLSVFIGVCIVSAAAQTAPAVVSLDASGYGNFPSVPPRSNLATSTKRPSASADHPSARSRRPLTEAELLSGINLTEDQKRSIDEIHRTMRTRMEIVSKDENESPEQKSAMLEGMSRMQLRQVFEVLKADQREQVKKRISAMRSAQHEKGQPEPQQRSN